MKLVPLYNVTIVGGIKDLTDGSFDDKIHPGENHVEYFANFRNLIVRNVNRKIGRRIAKHEQHATCRVGVILVYRD